MKKRRFAGILLLLAMSVLLLCATAEAATTKQKALAAYKSFLAKNVVTRNARGAVTNPTTGISKFAIIYFNSDSIPDLVVERTGYYYTPYIYTYKNGKMTKIASAEVGLHCTLYKYFKKKGCLVFRYEGNGYPYHGVAYRYFALKSGKVIYRLEQSWQQSGSVKKNYSYYWNSKNTIASVPAKTISKSVFTAKKKAIVGSTTAAKLPFHTNTATNRKKYCA